MISLKNLIREYNELGPRSDKNPNYLKDGRKIFSADGIDWVIPKRSVFNKAVLINVDKFDAEWSKDDLGYYFPPGHVDGRTERFIEFLNQYPNTPIVMPQVSYHPKYGVGFTNGRHRYSYFRDKGIKHIYMSVDGTSQVNIFKKLFS